MSPKRAPKWSPFGRPQHSGTIVIPCAFALDGPPKGPRVSPEMGSEVGRNSV